MEQYRENLNIAVLNAFIPPHINPELEIVYLRRGTVQVIYDSWTLSMKAGEMLLIQPYHLHSFQPSEDVDADVFMFSHAIYHDFAERIGGNLVGKVCRVETPVVAYLAHLEEQLQNGGGLFLARSLFYSCIAICMEGEPVHRSVKLSEDFVPRAAEYIFDRLETDITVGELARHMGWEPRRFSSEFKERYGIKITDFISNIRIERAVTLLETTNATITQIVMACGFGSMRNFNRVFQLRTGCDPSEYRRKVKSRREAEQNNRA